HDETHGDDGAAEAEADLQHASNSSFHLWRSHANPFHNISPATTIITARNPHVSTPTRIRGSSLPPANAPRSTPAATGPARYGSTSPLSRYTSEALAAV